MRDGRQRRGRSAGWDWKPVGGPYRIEFQVTGKADAPPNPPRKRGQPWV